MRSVMRGSGRLAATNLREFVRALPSTMSRLVFLSGLRDLNSGVYHASTTCKPEPGEVDQVLRSLHEDAFSTWLNYRFEEQQADLDLYFSGLECGKATALQTWLHLESYRSFVPASASLVERRLFYGDLELLLYLAAYNVSGAGDRDEHCAHAEQLITVKEMSSRLGVSCRTLRQWAEHKEMPAVKLGRQWRSSTAAVRDWLGLRHTEVNNATYPTSNPPDHAAPIGTSTCAVPCSGIGIADLSPREREVLMLIGQGKGSKEIADLMSISESTVSEYRKRVCRKLGLHTTVTLAACALGRLLGTCRHSPSKNAKALT